MAVRVWEVLDASETARSAYLRVLSQPTARDVAQNAICLLLWLETTMGFDDVLHTVATMAPFVVAATTPPEDSRTVFVAVPEGNPLTSEYILNYFESTMGLGFGFCIERVAMERPSAGQPAKHGVVVFSSVALRAEAMMGESATFFRVDDGRDMWVQAYLPPC